jgi:hypothetical protein
MRGSTEQRGSCPIIDGSLDRPTYYTYGVSKETMLDERPKRPRRNRIDEGTDVDAEMRNYNDV